MIELNNHFLALFLGWEEALAEAPPASTVAPMSCSGAAAFCREFEQLCAGKHVICVSEHWKSEPFRSDLTELHIGFLLQ